MSLFINDNWIRNSIITDIGERLIDKVIARHIICPTIAIFIDAIDITRNTITNFGGGPSIKATILIDIFFGIDIDISLEIRMFDFTTRINHGYKYIITPSNIPRFCDIEFLQSPLSCPQRIIRRLFVECIGDHRTVYDETRNIQF